MILLDDLVPADRRGESEVYQFEFPLEAILSYGLVQKELNGSPSEEVLTILLDRELGPKGHFRDGPYYQLELHADDHPEKIRLFADVRRESQTVSFLIPHRMNLSPISPLRDVCHYALVLREWTALVEAAGGRLTRSLGKHRPNQSGQVEAALYGDSFICLDYAGEIRYNFACRVDEDWLGASCRSMRCAAAPVGAVRGAARVGRLDHGRACSIVHDQIGRDLAPLT